MHKSYKELLGVATGYGIKIEFWDFLPPVDAVYHRSPGGPPVIGLNNSLLKEEEAYLRSVIAENIGHFLITKGNPTTCFHLKRRKSFSKTHEFCAARWAAEHLIPLNELKNAIRAGIKEINNLAKYFCVTEEIMSLRMINYNNNGAH